MAVGSAPTPVIHYAASLSLRVVSPSSANIGSGPLMSPSSFHSTSTSKHVLPSSTGMSHSSHSTSSTHSTSSEVTPTLEGVRGRLLSSTASKMSTTHSSYSTSSTHSTSSEATPTLGGVRGTLLSSVASKMSTTSISHSHSVASITSLRSSAYSSLPTLSPSLSSNSSSSQAPGDRISLLSTNATSAGTSSVPSSTGTSPVASPDKNGSIPSSVPIGSAKANTQGSSSTAAIAGGVVGGLLVVTVLLFILIRSCRRHRGSSSNVGSRAYLRYSQSDYGRHESRLARLFGGRGGSRMSDTSFLSDSVRARGIQISSPMPLMLERERDARFLNFATGPTPPILNGTGPAFTVGQEMPATASSQALARAHTLGRGHAPQLSYDSYAEDIQSPFSDPPAVANDRRLAPISNPSRIITDPRTMGYHSSERRLPSYSAGAATPLSQFSTGSESVYSNEEGDLGPFEDVMIPSPTDTLRPPRPMRSVARPSAI